MLYCSVFYFCNGTASLCAEPNASLTTLHVLVGCIVIFSVGLILLVAAAVVICYWRRSQRRTSLPLTDFDEPTALSYKTLM